MEYEMLRLDNQLCFPLYAAAKEVVKRYKPHLDAIGLTYTQYITLMVLWEQGATSVKAIGERLYLDSGTLTPLLKKLEGAGLVRRSRSETDERVLLVEPTPAGMALREQAKDIPGKIGACMPLCPEDAATLYRILHTLLGGEENLQGHGSAQI